MKPFLCFLGGCEFEYIILELKSNPQKYFDFDYFSSFEHRGQTNPYTFLSEHAKEALDLKPDVVILSQHDFMMGSKKKYSWITKQFAIHQFITTYICKISYYH